MSDMQALRRRSHPRARGGSGALLGGAAGDVLAAGSDRVYGFATQHMVLTAYHLLRRGTIDQDGLGAELAGLAYSETGSNVYRAEEPWFRAWLDESRRGSPGAFPFENTGAAVRMIPIGVWFRTQPETLIEESLRATLVTHNHPGAVVAACAFAGAIAGASYGQSGRDLVFGAAEVAKAVEERVAALGSLGPAKAGTPPLSLLLRHAVNLVGRPVRHVAAEVRSWTPDAASAGAVLTSIVAGAPILERPSIGVREAVGISHHPREVAVMTGALVGARVGLHRWPWPIVNDLWFAELGRRLSANDRRFEDLPDPYAVEEVLSFSEPAVSAGES